MKEWKHKWNAFLQLNKTVNKEAIVFAGDSITEGFRIHELFPREYPLYNRGISGITSVQLLDHIEEHILQLSPKKLFLLIGTNDLGKGSPVSKIAERIELICIKTMEKLPQCKIYLFTVYPVNREIAPASVGERDNRNIGKLNKKIERISKRYAAVELINLDAVLKDEKGNLKAEYTYDGLHLQVRGYREIAKRLVKLI